MTFWIGLWKITLLLSLAVFGVLSVWVTVQGARDIKSLLADLYKQHEERED